MAKEEPNSGSVVVEGTSEVRDDNEVANESASSLLKEDEEKVDDLTLDEPPTGNPSSRRNAKDLVPN